MNAMNKVDSVPGKTKQISQDSRAMLSSTGCHENVSVAEKTGTVVAPSELSWRHSIEAAGRVTSRLLR